MTETKLRHCYFFAFFLTVALNESSHARGMANNRKNRLKRWISPLTASAIKMRNCDQSMIPVMQDFNLTKFSGGWFELGKTTSGHLDLDDGVWKIISFEKSSRFIFSGRNSMDYCIPPIKGLVISSPDNPGELVLHYRTHSNAVSERLRVLYTDYENVAVVYSCLYVDDKGSCHPGGVFGAIWTRLVHGNSMDYEGGLTYLNRACIASHSVRVRNRVGSCRRVISVITSDPEDIPNKLSNDMVCEETAECALNCPPCCRKLNGCIKCDCESIPDDDYLQCVDPSECPSSCISRPKHIGCFLCSCDEIIKDDIPAICLEVKEEGRCHLNLTRYYFNANTRTCEPFQYNGCEGTANNFENLGACLKACKGLTYSEGLSLESRNTTGKVNASVFFILMLFTFVPLKRFFF